MPVTKAQVKQVALSFPGTLEKPSYGRPAFFVEKKFFTRVRNEDNSLVMRVGSIEQRDMMLELDPETYFITDHYRDWPAILVRLSAITPGELKIMLERRWREIAPKKLVREAEGQTKPARKATKKNAGKKAAKAAPRSNKADRARASRWHKVRT
jgi:hypothetical protein